MTPQEPPEPAITVVRYNVGFIVLSYIVSLIGCITTLELLHRRTSRRGAYNWYLLVSSCITMGGVGIWCMHFIGNHAIVMDQGRADRQVLYSPAFTAISFFLPILVLLVAFYILGITYRVNRYYITLSGCLSGTAICGMHYLGQLGIVNYSCTYQVQYVVGAAAIAVVASLIALSVFFRLRELWTDSWWKRSLCGATLACAVSGMHWTAAVGTSYKPRGGNTMKEAQSRISTVIVATILSVVTCVILLCFAFVATRKKHLNKTRAQQLVLACGYFDEGGRVMVTPEGGLPCSKITNHYVEKTFGEEELSRTHPTFIWVFRASHNWPAIKLLIPGIRRNLETDPLARSYRPGNTTPVDSESEAALDFSAVFKQLFCVAAQNLANIIHEPLEKLGILFEEPLETGTTKTPRYSGFFDIGNLFCTSQKNFDKIPGASDCLGRGQYLSVTRCLSQIDVNRFAAQGYRFATIPSIADPMAKMMQVPHARMLQRLQRMRNTVSPENLLPPGLNLACFVLRPSVHKSFDILVPAVKQNQLPVATLPVQNLLKRHLKELQKIDEWTVADILKDLLNSDGSVVGDQNLRWQLHRAFSQLVELVGDPPLMMQAKFSSKPVRAPCRPPPGSIEPTTCIIFSIRAIETIHARAPRPDMTYVPLSFFSVQQHMQSGAQSHERFVRQALSEFSDFLGRGDPPGRKKSWMELKTTYRNSISSLSMSTKSRFSSSFQRQISLRMSHESYPPIVSIDTERDWVEAMETRQRQGDATHRKPESMTTNDTESGSEDEQVSEMGVPSIVVPVSPLHYHGRGGDERRAPAMGQDHHLGRGDDVAMVQFGSPDTKAEGDENPTFVNELFALFRLQL